MEGAEVDRTLEALSRAPRRRVLAMLMEHPEGITLDEAVEGVGAGEQGRVHMVHGHLPKLDDLGYVRWDRDAGRIQRGPEWDTLEPLLRCLDDWTALPDDRA